MVRHYFMLVVAVAEAVDKVDIQLVGTAEAEAEKVRRPTTVLVLQEQLVLAEAEAAGI
jgi:hypothetical protein